MKNRSSVRSESGEAPIHLRESLYGISIEPLLSENYLAELLLNSEAALETLPNILKQMQQSTQRPDPSRWFFNTFLCPFFHV